MDLKYIQQKYIKYNKGNGFICCLVDALHAMPPKSDQFTDKIVERLITKTGCAGIIGTVSRTEIDLNRIPSRVNYEGIIEYRSAIKDILEYVKLLKFDNNLLIRPYLHLSFHGMKDIHHGPYAIEIGTLRGNTCSPEIRQWFEETLRTKTQEVFPTLNIVFDKKFIGNISIGFHRLGDGKDYPGYQHNFHSFQIEISHSVRSKYYLKISDIFSQLILDFQSNFVSNPL